MKQKVVIERLENISLRNRQLYLTSHAFNELSISRYPLSSRLEHRLLQSNILSRKSFWTFLFKICSFFVVLQDTCVLVNLITHGLMQKSVCYTKGDDDQC